MANILTAGNSSNGGTAISTDTSGTLNIVTGSGSGSNAITIDASQAVTMPGNLTVTGTLNAGALTNTTGSFSGNLSFNSGYGSAAVAYGCRAWVSFVGSTAVIRSNGNVSSITRTAAGDYTVNFTTAMPDANYSFALSSQNITGAPTALYQNSNTTPTTSAIRFAVANSSTGVLADSAIVCCSIFR